MDIKYLAQTYAVSPQLLPSDVSEIKAQGFTTLICNRPDGEATEQPTADSIRAAAEREGLAFYHIPMNGPTMTAEQVEQLASILAGDNIKALAYCRTGNRSSIIWNALQQTIS